MNISLDHAAAALRSLSLHDDSGIDLRSNDAAIPVLSNKKIEIKMIETPSDRFGFKNR